MENERVEALNRGLAQNLSELDHENRYHKKTVQTLKETNEDIYSKFQTLQSDLHQQKVIRNNGQMWKVVRLMHSDRLLGYERAMLEGGGVA